jgi:hypothetical protein
MVGLIKGVMVTLLASKLTITPVIKPTIYHTGCKQGNHYTFDQTHHLPHWM